MKLSWIVRVKHGGFDSPIVNLSQFGSVIVVLIGEHLRVRIAVAVNIRRIAWRCKLSICVVVNVDASEDKGLVGVVQIVANGEEGSKGIRVSGWKDIERNRQRVIAVVRSRWSSITSLGEVLPRPDS